MNAKFATQDKCTVLCSVNVGSWNIGLEFYMMVMLLDAQMQNAQWRQRKSDLSVFARTESHLKRRPQLDWIESLP
jgi:hypothetical protein